METIERDYSPKGVKFIYIYKALAHPGNEGYIQPVTIQERLLHIAEAKRKLGTKFQWICDSMDNKLKHTLGDRPNSEFLIDPKGKILASRQWSSASALRADLVKHVGDVTKPTSLAQLGFQMAAAPKRAATGIVKPLELPSGLIPVQVETQVQGDAPVYVKLRAEMAGDQLYLRFSPDPIHKVHWNNEAPALEFSLDPPQGLEVTPSDGKGPKVEAKADADPREFLVTIAGSSTKPIKVTLRYFACDDAETFCKPVTQEYFVTLERDSDAGSRRSSSGRGRPGFGPGMRRGFGPGRR